MAILEFIQVLVAIILGLGVAELLKGYADFLRPGRRQPSALLFGLSIWLFLQLIQFWWSGWRFAEVNTWQFYELLAYLFGPTILYILARLIFPNATESQDLTQYYSEVSSRLWSLVAAFFVFAVMTNIWLLSVPVLSVGPLSQALLAAYALVCFKIQRVTLHAIGIALMLVQLMWRGLTNVVAS